ncbi:MAG: flagellar hook assembly protein FlgD [Bacteriovoracaceae bacterium]|jgi:flagellar basal-body rod modification protein FlgD|nr:flagellar hook assembly protein FlgD [Bacteriovoracaceae bacterium]
MPTMGRPISNKKNPLANVRMLDPGERAARYEDQNEKQRLLNKLTGYKPQNNKFVDAKTHNKMGKDEFLKLLTHQLANQDPNKPMDQKQMASQLAQFSQLEQLTNLNTKFDKVVKNDATQDKFYGASFLGKEIITTGASMKLEEDGASADVYFELPKEAPRVLVRVYDKQNAMISEIWKENLGRGNHTMTWDGTSMDGTAAGKGEYRTQVYAWDNNQEPIAVDTKSRGIVKAVNFENGEAVLTINGGKKVFLRDVDSFHVPSKNTKKSLEAKIPQNNLPVAKNNVLGVNLESSVKNSINSYKKNTPDTGITNVYDVE